MATVHNLPDELAKLVREEFPMKRLQDALSAFIVYHGEVTEEEYSDTKIHGVVRERLKEDEELAQEQELEGLDQILEQLSAIRSLQLEQLKWIRAGVLCSTFMLYDRMGYRESEIPDNPAYLDFTEFGVDHLMNRLMDQTLKLIKDEKEKKGRLK